MNNIRIAENNITTGKHPFQEGFSKYGVTWDSGIDNHTHGLKIGGIHTGGNPTEDNLLFDLVLSEKLGLDEYELITNTYTHTMLAGENQDSTSQHALAEYMVINDIPNYLSQYGPHHPVVDEARENKHLKFFRKWISDKSILTSTSELKEAKESVEAAIQEAQNKLFLKYLDPSSFYKSLGKSVVGDGIGLLIPGTSTIATVVENMTDRKERENIRWQGFLVSMKGKI
jgi:hypothetical protein